MSWDKRRQAIAIMFYIYIYDNKFSWVFELLTNFLTQTY